jgi:hypothetical protein
MTEYIISENCLNIRYRMNVEKLPQDASLYVH